MIQSKLGRGLIDTSTPGLLIVALLGIVILGQLSGVQAWNIVLTEMLIRVVVVVGIYMFVGNSGIISFGHIGFMCIGAYGAAWATVSPEWKEVMLVGLPTFLQGREYPFIVAVIGGATLAACVALILGCAIMRLSGIAASIASFAFMAIIHNVYSNWDSVTAGTSSIIGIPTVVDAWMALAFAALAIGGVFLYQRTPTCLLLRCTREDDIAAQSSAISIFRVRLLAFVGSAFVVGLGGALQAHFLGILSTNIFYLDLTFITLAMLVVGGMGSLSGAVVGVVVVTGIVTLLRAGEGGIHLAEGTIKLPLGSQEIGLGLMMALVLVFRPKGIIRGRDLSLPISLITRSVS
jgi:branched-chain amino acid transport system permease protein